MARTSKPKTARRSAKTDSVTDAVIVGQDPVESAVSGDAATSDETAAPQPGVDGADTGEPPRPDEAVELPEPVSDAAETPAEPVETPPDAPEPAPLPDPAPTAEAPAPPPPPAKSGGSAPLILGGVVAAALGAGAMFLVGQQGWLAAPQDTQALTAQADMLAGQATRLDSQAAEIAAIRAEVAALPAALDGLRADLSDSGATDALAGRIDALAARIAAIEVQPIPEAQLPQSVVDAYETRLAQMQAALDAQMTDMQAQLDARLADIAAQSDTAAELERQAQAGANASATRAALAELDAALNSGTPFAAALAEVAQRSGTAVPDALAATAENGIPTLPDLQQEFPDAARAALDAATRAAVASGEVDRLTAFMRTQLGARSLEPREGADADAVLSRAEAALAAGDLDTALAELAALPEDGKTEMAQWMTRAETRRAALAAAAAFSAMASSN